MGLFLAGAVFAWVAIVVMVVAACRAAAQGDLALVAVASPRRACETRRRRVLRRVLSTAHR